MDFICNRQGCTGHQISGEKCPKVTNTNVSGSPFRELRNSLLELYGMASAFKMLKPNGLGLQDEVKAAMETGKIIEERLKKLIMELP